MWNFLILLLIFEVKHLLLLEYQLSVHYQAVEVCCHQRVVEIEYEHLHHFLDSAHTVIDDVSCIQYALIIFFSFDESVLMLLGTQGGMQMI